VSIVSPDASAGIKIMNVFLLVNLMR